MDMVTNVGLYGVPNALENVDVAQTHTKPDRSPLGGEGSTFPARPLNAPINNNRQLAPFLHVTRYSVW